MIKQGTQAGFTFIEVLVAMLMFVMAVLAAVSIADGSVKATREAKEISTATWLLQSTMVDLETKVETLGLEKGCEKKKEGKFERPFEKYTFTTYCNEIDFKLSETAAQMSKEEGSDDGDNNANKQDMVQKMILDTASTYMSKALRELHAEVTWFQGKTKRQVAVTTHWTKLDLPVQLPGGIPQGGVGGGGGVGQ